MPSWTCPLCNDKETRSRLVLMHLVDHKAVKIRPAPKTTLFSGRTDLAVDYECGCGFCGTDEAMRQHWCTLDARQHLSLLALMGVEFDYDPIPF